MILFNYLSLIIKHLWKLKMKVAHYPWVTADLRRLAQPVPVRGRQGLFELAPAEEAAVREQLAEIGKEEQL